MCSVRFEMPRLGRVNQTLISVSLSRTLTFSVVFLPRHWYPKRLLQYGSEHLADLLLDLRGSQSQSALGDCGLRQECMPLPPGR